MESAVIVKIAERLLEKLSREDPVAKRVELSRPEYFWCGLQGVSSALFSKKA